MNGLDYYAQVKQKVGATMADASLRMFMVPGMGHCEGGVGADTFDAMEPLSQWVERGVVPAQFEAKRVVDGAVVRTRPLCAYPSVARWNGRGDSRAAATFSCVAP